MIEQIIWINFIIPWMSVPTMAIIGILFHIQRKTKGSLILAIGYSAILIGIIIELIFPQTFETMEEATQVLETSGPQLLWFIPSVITSIGMILATIGFGLVVVDGKKA